MINIQIKYLNGNIMDDVNMNVLFSIDISNVDRPVYTVDNSSLFTAFDRVAYHMELVHMEYGHQSVYISMNPFTDDVHSLGVPDHNDFKQTVSNVTLKTNVLSLHQGKHDTALIDFSHQAYTPIKGTNNNIECVHGCMQFHLDGVCIFAYNNFNSKNTKSDVGIGNATGNYRDWSFMRNGDEYLKKTLTVFVKPFVYTTIINDSILWRGCYSLDIPVLRKRLDYNFDLYNFRTHNLPFERVGFLMHLGNIAFGNHWVWVAMDAFTSQHCDITIPLLNGLVHNRIVKNIDIVSSVHGEIHKTDGFIRISPYDYFADVFGRLGYDDTVTNYGEYGCFQIYDGHPTLDETNALISYNNFYGIPDVGIGTQTPMNRNWTLAANGQLYETRRLEIATKPCRACYFVPETHDMKLLYSIDVPNVGPIAHTINNYQTSINRPFTRVGYFVEINDVWLYVSFDWNDIQTVGIPTQYIFTYVENAVIKAGDGRDIESKSKVWLRFTPFNYIPYSAGSAPDFMNELFTGAHGCMQIGYGNEVMWSCSNLNGEVNIGFYGTEVPASTFDRRNIQVFINRHKHVPDVVFLVTGQSNSQGTGGYYDPIHSDDTTDDNILSWNIQDKSWDVASLERYMGTKPLLSQCYGFHFAKQYIKRFPQRKVGLVVCGSPGQSICRWSHVTFPRSSNYKKDVGDIYDKTVLNMFDAISKSNTKQVDGILWHQGESDHNESHTYYRNRLEHVIQEYRRAFGKKTAFIAGELLKCENGSHKQNDVLRELNHNKDCFSRCTFSKNLEQCGDNLHFSTQSHRILGDMYFEQYMIIQYMAILNQ